ncbi:hypothetical protein RND81_11G011700 [Saponaria officinalis]|uniref:Coilin n=1 Tax=Saponaria officinalis TaxID=3572 RepID=A0AAW1HIB3_SAPOF
MEAEKLRIRLVFGNGVLTKFQRKDGLKRSWLLLKPHFLTISDVVSYILHSFDLHHSCPRGIILSMDGFVLPEFESTSILKDKDLISVKRKETRLLTNEAIEDAMLYIEDEIVEKQLLAPGVRLLANEEFDRETEGCENETERSPARKVARGDLASKKRKAPSKLQKTKKKRKIQAIVNTIQDKKLPDGERISKPTKKREHENTSDQNGLSDHDDAVKSVNDSKPESNTESEHDENKEDTIQASAVPDKAKKVSRSTLRRKSRKKIKKMLRHQAKMNECDGQQPVKDMTMDIEPGKDTVATIGPEKDTVATIVLQDDEEEESDADGELVPVEIRPGLIRFTPSGKVKEVEENLEANASDVHSTENGTWEDHSARKDVSDVTHNQVAKEAYCWNGITNKRKGQKWGQETQSSSTWKESRNHNTHSSNTWTDKKQSTSSWHQSGDVNGQSNETRADKERHSNNKSVDFDKLIPLIDLPKVGDVIAYRVLELSSSWCPELSSFRVGKISSFEQDSNRIMLVPVPEYPLNLEKHDDDDELPLRSSIYNDDGSLEIDFPSLNDVRIVKLGDVTQTKSTIIFATNGNSSPSTCKKVDEADGSKKAVSDVRNQELHAPANSKKDVWEEITEAVSEKKAKLTQEDSWNKKQDAPVKRPWSYRSLRSSAIGPTMARLRAQNGT